MIERYFFGLGGKLEGGGKIYFLGCYKEEKLAWGQGRKEFSQRQRETMR